MESVGLPSTFSFTDNDKKNLELLLQTFGSGVSLEDIASAYSQSGRNFYDACSVLCSLQRSTSKSLENLESASVSSMCPSENSLEMMTKATMSKSRKSSASLGTVSGVIGKGYVKPQVSNGGYFKPKPVKLNAHDIPESELWDDKDFYSPANGDTMHQDVEEFLFEMLGKGFSLDKSVISDIVGQCGYDVTKSMDKLLYLSASKLEKSDDILELVNAKSKARLTQHEPLMPSASGSLKHNFETGSSSEQLDDVNKKQDLEKEVLNSLFCLTVRPEEELRRYNATRTVKRSSPYGTIVEKPMTETMIEYRSVIRKKEATENDKDRSYEDLRKAVKEYWSIMREYYRAASDAFANEDIEKAKKLMDEGHFYMVKAREADEESAEKLLERGDEEELFLDLLDFEPKEAVRFLKVQLNSFCGIGSMKHLKARVKSDEENGKVGPLKRLITKFLQREDIKWTEEGDGSIFAISLDQIDRNKLSFANK